MTKPIDGTWVSYSGTAKIDLAIVLVAAAAGVLYAGTRLGRPVRLPRPGETAIGIMVAAWLLAIVAFLICAHEYVRAMRQHHLPLFLVEFATLSFLTIVPIARPTKATFFTFATMLAVFAAWALSGFAYPATPGPFAFNVLSKILAFATALTLFLPRRSEAHTGPPAAASEGAASQPSPQAVA